MSVYNDNNDLKHPAFHDEQQIEKKKWQAVSKILDVLFCVVWVLGLIAGILFCIWLMYFKEI